MNTIFLILKTLRFRGISVCMFSHLRLFATPWTLACQAPLSMGFSQPEYWSGLPFPLPGFIPDPGIEPKSPALAGRFFSMSHWENPSEGLDNLPKTTYLMFLCCSYHHPVSHPLIIDLKYGLRFMSPLVERIK